MDIKNISNAMDNMPMGDGSAFAEINIGPAKHEEFLNAHYKKVALVLTLIVLAIAGWIIYTGVKQSTEEAASALLVSAMPGAYDDAKGLNSEILARVISEYPETKAAISASYLQGLALWEAGRENDGITHLENFIAVAPTPEWKNQASITLACHYMNSNQAEKAGKLFQAVVDSADPVYAAFAAMSLGDIARAQGNQQAAADAYRSLKDNHPKSTFTSDANIGYPQRELLLNIQNPKNLDTKVEQ